MLCSHLVVHTCVPTCHLRLCGSADFRRCVHHCSEDTRVPPLSLSAAATDDTAATNSVLATALPMLGRALPSPPCPGSTRSASLASRRRRRWARRALGRLGHIQHARVLHVLPVHRDDQHRRIAGGRRRARGRALFDGVMISLLVGGLAAAAMTFGRRVLVGGFLGAGAESGIFAPACAYLRIRALAAPAATATLVGAGVCFGLGDQITPVRAIAAAAAVNVVGDLLLIGPCGLGLSGAAAATALANYAAAAMVVGPLWRRYRRGGARPRYADLRRFAAVSGALLAGTSFASLTYAATPRVVSGDVTRAAAHQIALSLWWLISFVSVPLSLAGQSLLPRRLSADPAPCAPHRTRHRSAGSVLRRALRRSQRAHPRLGGRLLEIARGPRRPRLRDGDGGRRAGGALVRDGARRRLPRLRLARSLRSHRRAVDVRRRRRLRRRLALRRLARRRLAGPLPLRRGPRSACHAAALPLLLRKLAGDARSRVARRTKFSLSSAWRRGGPACGRAAAARTRAGRATAS